MQLRIATLERGALCGLCGSVFLFSGRVRGRLKHRGTEARRKKGKGREREAGKGMVRRGALCGLCGSVFLFWGQGADGGNTEAQRHRE